MYSYVHVYTYTYYIYIYIIYTHIHINIYDLQSQILCNTHNQYAQDLYLLGLISYCLYITLIQRRV